MYAWYRGPTWAIRALDLLGTCLICLDQVCPVRVGHHLTSVCVGHQARSLSRDANCSPHVVGKMLLNEDVSESKECRRAAFRRRYSGKIHGISVPLWDCTSERTALKRCRSHEVSELQERILCGASGFSESHTGAFLSRQSSFFGARYPKQIILLKSLCKDLRYSRI